MTYHEGYHIDHLVTLSYTSSQVANVGMMTLGIPTPVILYCHSIDDHPNMKVRSLQ
jgi:hypothetical protein